MPYKLLLILTAYLPFQLAINPAEGIDLASVRVFILILFLFWLAQGFVKRKVIIQKNKSIAFLVLFLFLNAFSLFFASNIDWSIRKLLYLFSIFPLYFAVASIVDSREKALKLFKVLVFSGTLAAVVGIVQFLLQFFLGIDRLYKIWAAVEAYFLGTAFSEAVLAYPSWLVNVAGRTYFRAVSFFPDPHMFAFFLGLLFPVALGLFFSDRKKIWLFSAGIIFLADILTFSRGGYLGLVGGSVALFFIFRNQIGKKYKLVVLTASVFLILALIIPSPISSRFFSSFNLSEGSNQGRLAMWKKATEVIFNRPMTGTGLGNFPLTVNPLADYRTPIYSHNTYLDIAAETGIFSGLAWIGFLFSSFSAFLKKSKEDGFFLWPAVSLIVFSVHSLVETGIYSPVVLAALLMIAGTGGIKKLEQVAQGNTN